jgi:hypothetical protein
MPEAHTLLIVVASVDVGIPAKETRVISANHEAAHKDHQSTYQLL